MSEGERKKINVSWVFHIWLIVGLPHHSAQGGTSSNSLYRFPPSEKEHSCSACQLSYRVAFRWNSVRNNVNKWFVNVKTFFDALRPQLQSHSITFVLRRSTLSTFYWIRMLKVAWVLPTLTSAHVGCYFSDMAHWVCIIRGYRPLLPLFLNCWGIVQLWLAVMNLSTPAGSDSNYTDTVEVLMTSWTDIPLVASACSPNWNILRCYGFSPFCSEKHLLLVS